MFNKLNQLNAAGKLAVGVISIAMLAALIVAGRSIWIDIRGLDALEPVPTSLPTATATEAPTTTPEPTATPEGWVKDVDFAGAPYLAPPEDIEKEIRAAFQTVLRCDLVEDSETIFEDFDRQAVIEAAREVAVDSVVASECDYLTRGKVDGRWSNVFLYDDLGPQNPVRCEDHDTCIIGRVRKASTGVLVFDMTSEECEEVSGEFREDTLGTVCLVRDFEDHAPGTLREATVERNGQGDWIVTEWETIKSE
jgi:hypothetical protein